MLVSEPLVDKLELYRSSREEEGFSVIVNFWERLHDAIEVEKTGIEDLLKESSDNEYKDEFGFRELKGLYGTISIHALTLIREQYTLAREKQYAENCSCIIRSTHGLPCAHEIDEYIKEARPIPLECVNSFGRKLDLEPLRRTGEANVDRSIKRRKLSEIMDTNTPYVPLLPNIVESVRNSPDAALNTRYHTVRFFFPFQNPPVPMSAPFEIAIGYCEEHFVQVNFKRDHMLYNHPMPPAAHLPTKKVQSVFHIQQQQCSEKWAARYSARIQQFSASLQPIVSSRENLIFLDTEYF